MGHAVTGCDITAVRQELANLALPNLSVAVVELGVLVRMGGVWQRSGGMSATTTVMVSSPVGAVVRRTRRLCDRVGLLAPTLQMRRPGGVRTTTTWAARLAADSLGPLGVVTPTGTPRIQLPDWSAAPGAALRAILLVATSVSAPHSAAHLEVTLPSNVLAGDVTALFATIDVRLHHDPDRQRLVAKSGDAIVTTLAHAGAVGAAEEHAEQQRRRGDRSAAVAMANADQANLRRVVAAASGQIEDLRRLRAAAGWTHVPSHLKEAALTRLATPSATLAEIGQLCDPPVGKSTVHRRMAQLRDLAARLDEDSDSWGGDGDHATTGQSRLGQSRVEQFSSDGSRRGRR